MVRLLIVLLFAGACAKEDQSFFSVDTSFALRTVDVKKANYSDDSTPVVVSLDTKPTCGSKMFESVLKYYGYEYVLLGSPKTDSQPKLHALFKQALWYFRFNRYYNEVVKINAANPNKIVILSDAGDVLFGAPPSEIVSAYNSIGKNIVLSGTAYCCNVPLYKYIKKIAEDQFGLDEKQLLSTEPKTKQLVYEIGKIAQSSAGYFNRPLRPFFLWTEEAEKELEGILKIPMKPKGPATKFRFVNAGTIIGTAAALKKAMEEIPNEPFADDENLWNNWYSSIGHETGEGTIDYEQNIFAVLDEMQNRDNEASFLFADQTEMPSFKFFDLELKNGKWVSKFNSTPQIFHCAGCPENKMSTFRRNIMDTIDGFKSLAVVKETLGDKCKIR